MSTLLNLTIAVALTEIRRQPVTIDPGTTFGIPDPADFEKLSTLGAVRPANDAEKALFNSLPNGPTLPNSDTPRAKAEAEAAAAEKAKAEAEAAAAEKAKAEAEAAAAEKANLVAKHVGGGRYRVEDQAGGIVSGETLFQSKDEAEAWIADQGSKSPESGSSDHLLG
jgi:membrane protein involved in colicin uptake